LQIGGNENLYLSVPPCIGARPWALNEVSEAFPPSDASFQILTAHHPHIHTQLREEVPKCGNTTTYPYLRTACGTLEFQS